MARKPAIKNTAKIKHSHGEWWRKFSVQRHQMVIIATSVGLLVSLILFQEIRTQNFNLLGISFTAAPTLSRDVETKKDSTSTAEDNFAAPPNTSHPVATMVPDLAQDFPVEVPIYPGLVRDTARSEVAKRKAWTLTIESQNSFRQVVTDFQNLLTTKGWVKESELVDDQSVTLAASKNNLSVVVYIMASGKTVKINYTVSELADNSTP